MVVTIEALRVRGATSVSGFVKRLERSGERRMPSFEDDVGAFLYASAQPQVSDPAVVWIGMADQETQLGQTDN